MDTGESTRISVNTIAQGRPDCFGGPVVTNSCAFFAAHEAAGAQNTRSSLRPRFSLGVIICKNSGASCSENADACAFCCLTGLTGTQLCCLRMPNIAAV